jgi:hypothetical protein
MCSAAVNIDKFCSICEFYSRFGGGGEIVKLSYCLTERRKIRMLISVSAVDLLSTADTCM